MLINHAMRSLSVEIGSKIECRSAWKIRLVESIKKLIITIEHIKQIKYKNAKQIKYKHEHRLETAIVNIIKIKHRPKQ